MTEETPSAYLVWWNQNHASDFTREGVYEKHSKKCFSAGYAIAAPETDELQAEVARLRLALEIIAADDALITAMDDLLAAPMGVVPASAEPFYNGRTGRFSASRAALAHGELEQ
jgi:hypothetical protein